MAVVTTNLGVVTAYGYAKQKGYTGTEAEFAQLLADYTDIAALTQNLPDIVADEYSTSSTYAVGDYCLHDGKLYVCTSAVTTAGAWNANNWTEISVADALTAHATEISEINTQLDEIIAGGSGLTSEAKNAILACFRGVAWRGDVDAAALYSALEAALNPPANLSSISAVYTQSGTVDLYDSLESLRSDLVVTAHYTDNTSAVVTSYTLSGQLTLGTSTITVSYGGKTTTFTVTVTSEWDYVWDLTQSLTDTVGGVTAVASAGEGVDAPVITSNGLVFNAATQRLSLGDINLDGKTIEIDVASFDFKGVTTAHMRFIVWNSNSGPMIFHKDSGWNAYGLPLTGNTPGWSSQGWGSTSALKKDRTIINGATVKVVFESENWNLYINNELYGTITDRRVGTGTFDLSIGGTSGYSQSAGDQCYDMTISAVRIKTNPTGGD